MIILKGILKGYVVLNWTEVNQCTCEIQMWKCCDERFTGTSNYVKGELRAVQCVRKWSNTCREVWVALAVVCLSGVCQEFEDEQSF